MPYSTTLTFWGYHKKISFQLSFETDKEKLFATGARVDIIWSAKIANLDAVTYVFDVHKKKKGSIDSLILNCRILNNPLVQKITAVSDKIQHNKISNETKSLSENFHKALTF